MVGRQMMTPTVNTPISRPCFAASALARGDALRRLLDRVARRLHEEGIAVAHRKVAADRRRAGVHDHRPLAAERLRLGAHLLQLDVLAVEVEVLAVRPHPLDRVEPVLRVFVAQRVLALLDAEHLELVLVPADHDVQPEAAFADVVGGDHLLGRDDRMEQRRVHGAEHGDALGRRQQPAGPGHGFERRVLIAGLAAIALPAADRQHEVDAGLVGHAHQLADCPARCRTSAPAPWSRPGPTSSWRRTARSSAGCRPASFLAAAMTSLHSARLSLRLVHAVRHQRTPASLATPISNPNGSDRYREDSG